MDALCALIKKRSDDHKSLSAEEHQALRVSLKRLIIDVEEDDQVPEKVHKEDGVKAIAEAIDKFGYEMSSMPAMARRALIVCVTEPDVPGGEEEVRTVPIPPGARTLLVGPVGSMILAASHICARVAEMDDPNHGTSVLHSSPRNVLASAHMFHVWTEINRKVDPTRMQSGLELMFSENPELKARMINDLLNEER